MTLAAQDNYNNTITNYSGTASITSGDARATLPATLVWNPADLGVKTVTGALFSASPAVTLSASDDAAGLHGVSNSVLVQPASPNTIVVAGPKSAPAASHFSLMLTAQDAFSNVATQYRGTLHFTSSDSRASLPADAAFGTGAAGVVAVGGFAMLTAGPNGTMTATDTVTPTLTGTSLPIVITPLTATQLVVTGATSGAAGHAQTLTVTARDTYGNLATSYAGQVGFTSSDGAAVLPTSYSFSINDAGAHTFSGVSLVSMGNQSITATDAAHASIAGSQGGVLITAGAATHLALSSSAWTTVAGAPVAVAIKALDTYNNPDPNFVGAVATGSSDPGAMGLGPYTFVVNDAGVHNSNIILTTVGAQNITVSGGLPGAQASVTVTVGGLSRLSVAGIANLAAGTTNSMVVRAVDKYNNTCTNYTGTAHFSSTDTNAILPANHTFLAGEQGARTTNLTLFTKGAQNVSATDTGNSNVTGSQNNIIVGVTQTQLRVVCNTNVIAGVGFNVTVSATDIYGNVNPNYTGTVAFSSPDANAHLPTSAVFAPGNQGARTFTSVILTQASAGQIIAASDGTYAGSQNNIIVNAGVPAGLVLTGPAQATAGAALSLTAQGVDAYNNIATTYRGSVAFTSSDTGATLPAPFTFQAANNGTRALTNSARLLESGAQTITISDSNNVFFASATISVQSATPSALVVVLPNNATAGVPINAQLLAEDIYGNQATSYTGTALLASTDANATFPATYTFSPNDMGSVTLNGNITFRTAGSQVMMAQDANDASISQGSGQVVVGAGNITHLAVVAPATVNSEAQYLVLVSGLDAYNNVVSNYGGTVGLTSTDANAVPSPTTPVNLVFRNGALARQSFFGLYFVTSGNQTLSAQDSVNPNGIYGTAHVNVAQLPAASLVVQGFPSPYVAGQQGNITVTAVDSYGNVATQYTGTVVFSASDPNHILPATYTFLPGDAGQRTFTGLQLHTVGSSQAVTATDAGHTISGAQSGIVVVAAPAAALLIAGNANATAGAPTSVLVTAKDAYNNIATGYAGTLHFTSTDANAALPADYPFNTSDAGVHAFNNDVTLIHAGAQNITVTDTNTAFVATLGMQVAGTNANALVLTAPGTSTAGQPLSLTLTALDVYGNTSVVYRGTVNFSGSDTNGTYLTGYTFTTGDHGVHAFNGNVILKTAGMQTVIASDANAGTHVGAGLANVTISPNSIHALSLSAPATVQPSFTFSATVAGVDAYGNQVPTYSGTVHLTSTDSLGTPSGMTPLTVVVPGGGGGQQSTSGVHLKTLGTQVLTAQDIGTPAYSATANVTVATLPFTGEYDYTMATAGNYSYSSKINIAGNNASLAPIYTSQGDTNSATFGAGSANNVLYDATGGYLRLNTVNANVNYGLYLGGETYDEYPVVSLGNPSSVDANNALGSSNMGAYCCGHYDFWVGSHAYEDDATFVHSGLGSMTFNGSAQGGTSTYAYGRVWTLNNPNLTLNNNATLSYWIYPKGHDLDYGYVVYGNNSLYASLVLLFSDGTSTATMPGLQDANNVVFSPSAQGAGGYLALDQWSYVQVDLSSLAGKQVTAIDIGWQLDGATLGFLGYVDDVQLLGLYTNNQTTNGASVDASWTPQYASITGYWPMDGAGRIANNTVVPATVGANLTANNADGAGLAYVNGHHNQAIYLDGSDDYLSHPTSGYPSGSAMTFSAWVRAGWNWGDNCPELFSFGSSATRYFAAAPFCYNRDWTIRSAVNSSTSTYNNSGNGWSNNQAWSHVAVTYDGLNANAYVNGLPLFSSSLAGTLSNIVGTHPYFGRANDGGNNYQGGIDEMVVWNVALSANEVLSIYERQSALYADTFTSRAMTSPFSGLAATAMNWNTTLPFFKALPGGNTVSEAVAAYPASFSGSLNSNLITYWTFEETTFGTVANGNDFADSSGNNNPALTWDPWNATPGVPGRFNRGVLFNGGDAGVIGQKQFSNPQVFSMQIWFRSTGNGPLISFGSSPNNYSRTTPRDRQLELEDDGHVTFNIQDGSLSGIKHVNDGAWHHAAAVHDGTQTTLYVDGAKEAQNLGGWQAQNFSGYWHVGSEMCWSCDAWVVAGVKDEVAIWDRALDPNEVLALYRRGANRQKYQVRTCGMAGCADNPNWSGPDGTAETYFSEINNVLGANAAPTSAWLPFANYPALVLNSSNAYVQYRAILETDDLSSKLCTYNGVQLPCSPETTAVKLFRINYDASSPPITLTSSALPYYGLTSLSQVFGSTGCTGGVKYVLSPDGSNWYYYSGSWVASNRTAAQANSSAQLTSSVLQAFATAYPYGSTYFSALLTSDGVNPCSLQSVSWAGTE